MGLLGRYPFTILVVLIALGAGIILYCQMPFGFYGPDLSFHAAKVLRAGEGDLFRDPFSGEYTLYPALYHAMLGLVIKFTGWNTFTLFRIGGALNLIGIMAGFFFLVRMYIGNTERAAVSTIAMSLVFWAPSARYILLFYPANFSCVFLLFGLGLAWKYVTSENAIYLAAGFFLQGLAGAIWWFNAVVSAAFFLTIGYWSIANRRGSWLPHLALAGVVYLLPWGFVVIHRYAIREVIPLYSETPQERPFNFEMLFQWLLTMLTRGNMPYMARIVPWNWASLETAMFATSSIFFRYVIGAIICMHFFILVLPFNLLLLFAAFRDTPRAVAGLRRLETGYLPLVAAMIILLLSIPMLAIGNLDHVRRVQFFFALLILMYIFGPYAQGKIARWLHAKTRWVAAAGILAFGYTAVYTTHVFPHEPAGTTQGIIDFIRALPDHRHQRLFFLEDQLCRVSPFVTFNSLVGHLHGRYFYQDVVSSERMFGHYMAIRTMQPGWRDALSNEGIRYLVFNTANSEDARLADFYRQYGMIVLENADWVIIDTGKLQSGNTVRENGGGS